MPVLTTAEKAKYDAYESEITDKVDKVAGKGLSDTNYTQTEKERLGHITISKDLNLDVLSDDQQVIFNRIFGLSHLAGDPTDGDDNLKTDHLSIAEPIRMEGDQIIPVDLAHAKLSRELLTVGSYATMTEGIATKTMMDKGTITDLNDISETGIYAGADVANSPVTGGIMVMANKDSDGNFGYFLMGADRVFHTGGRANGASVIDWANVKTDAVAEGDIPIDPDYGGGFQAILIEDFTAKATHNLLDEQPHKVSFSLKSGGNWADTMHPRAWYLIGSVGELGNLIGASGDVKASDVKMWSDNGAIVTITYQKTAKKFLVSKVEDSSGVHTINAVLADGSVKVEQNLVIGDRSGEGQLTIDAKTDDACHIIFKENGTKKNEILSLTDKLLVESSVGDIELSVPADNTISAKIGGTWYDMLSSIRPKHVTNMDEIVASGYYEGTDVIGVPKTGPIVITAIVDDAGNASYQIMGTDMRMQLGGKPNGQPIQWQANNPDHLSGTTAPDDAVGVDGDLYFQYA